MTDKLTYNVDELAELLGISRPVAYRLAKTADFPAVWVGRRVLIPREALHRWLETAAGRRP